ncbi:hypothetical protein L915_14910, partial [Phytophthora nicotianae]
PQRRIFPNNSQHQHVEDPSPTAALLTEDFQINGLSGLVSILLVSTLSKVTSASQHDRKERTETSKQLRS